MTEKRMNLQLLNGYGLLDSSIKMRQGWAHNMMPEFPSEIRMVLHSKIFATYKHEWALQINLSVMGT